MKLIRDEDRARIERVIRLLNEIDQERPRSLAGEAMNELNVVLANMKEFPEQGQVGYCALCSKQKEQILLAICDECQDATSKMPVAKNIEETMLPHEFEAHARRVGRPRKLEIEAE